MKEKEDDSEITKKSTVFITEMNENSDTLTTNNEDYCSSSGNKPNYLNELE